MLSQGLDPFLLWKFRNAIRLPQKSHAAEEICSESAHKLTYGVDFKLDLLWIFPINFSYSAINPQLLLWILLWIHSKTSDFKYVNGFSVLFFHMSTIRIKSTLANPHNFWCGITCGNIADFLQRISDPLWKHLLNILLEFVAILLFRPHAHGNESVPIVTTVYKIE